MLLTGRVARHDQLVASAASALTERGSAFTVSASFGVATAPDDATTASAVLQLADQRMYADKARTSHDRRAKTRDVLMQLLNERTPDLHEHVNGVGQLVADLAREFARDRLQLLVAFTQIARCPIHVAKAVENRAFDAVFRITPKADLLVFVVLQGGVEKTHDAGVDQIVEIYVDRQILINPHRDCPYQRKVFQHEAVALALVRFRGAQILD